MADRGPATRHRLDDRALESLEFIRTTMARSAAFTAVPGRGGIAMGILGTAAAIVASRQTDDRLWLGTWLAAAFIALPIGIVAIWWKAERHALPVWSANGRRFIQGYTPSLVAGAILTAALAARGRFDLLPAAWLLLYGAGLLAGSASSIPLLAWIGGAFMTLGVAAAVTGAAWRDVWLGAGFGGLQVIFGVMIARKHGG
jgi:hypothetical protein